MSLTQEQRTSMISSGRETKLRTKVGFTLNDLKEIGVLHYPERGRRALRPLGLEVDEEQLTALRAEFEASKSSSAREQQEGQEQTETPAAWLIRAGGKGERAESFIEDGIAAVGFGRLGDLSEVSSRDEMVELVKEDRPESSDGQARASASQLWAFQAKIRRGDLVVMPCRGNSEFALGTVTREYWYAYDADDLRHTVSVDWRRSEVPRTAMGEDLLRALRLRQTVNSIRSEDAARRLQQLLETGRDPGARVASDSEHLGVDLQTLVQQFLAESAYPTEAHEEQERLREEWAEKLAPANVASLSREDLLAYTNNAVDYGDYVDRGEGRRQQWIVDLDDAQYDRLLDGIRDLCWGADELSTRIDRLVDSVGGFNKDTGTKGFTGLQVSRTLAICHPEQFLPVPSQIGKWGREHMLRALGLPKPQGSYGQRTVDANDRLRKHLAPHLDDDKQAVACFLYWLREQQTDVGGDGEPDDETPDVSVLVQRFRVESAYPTEAHEEQKRLRADWAAKLAPESITDLSRQELTAVASHGTWNRAMYVYPNPRGVMQWIRNLDDDEYARMLDHMEYLCWNDDELWLRYDLLTDSRSDRKVKGLKNETTSRLLAICHPRVFLPIGTQNGRWSRETMLSRLGLTKPRGSSHGQRVVDANNRLREHLEPHFGDDTLAMGAFLEWLLQQELPESPADLPALATELLVGVEFLKDIVSLLEDKGQVILYGPPGTGKTYLARALVKVLAREESCRALVQFHPSTSYEDFFEGYRPAGTGDDGGIRFKLTPGPLARMAEQASEEPDQRHVMIIDEINRGNLPRVLGELLFLLEYRDESVQTLYRPDEAFSLPENLWFIGTMNTADRSIALVDAALRRRFHFVPFFPDSGPMAGLLSRWLDRKGEPDWVGRLVDSVNDELKAELEGSHLLLGPSHFMREYGAAADQQREQLRRIWEYNIEPFIEDQFFGDPDRIEHFRFNAVWNRLGPSGGRKAGTGEDPRGSEQGPTSAGSGSDRELWTTRASDFPPQGHPGDESYHAEMRQVVRRYVEFALNRGVDPGTRDDQLVEEFLTSHEPEYADKTKTDYQGHLRRWFNYADATWGT